MFHYLLHSCDHFVLYFKHFWTFHLLHINSCCSVCEVWHGFVEAIVKSDVTSLLWNSGLTRYGYI